MNGMNHDEGIVVETFKVLKERFHNWRIKNPLEYKELLNEVQLDSPSLHDSWIGFWSKNEQFMFRIKLIEGLSGKPINIERPTWDDYCKLHEQGTYLTVQIQHGSCVYTWDQNTRTPDGIVIKTRTFSVTGDMKLDTDLRLKWEQDSSMEITKKLFSIMKCKFSEDFRRIVIFY